MNQIRSFSWNIRYIENIWGLRPSSRQHNNRRYSDTRNKRNYCSNCCNCQGVWQDPGNLKIRVSASRAPEWLKSLRYSRFQTPLSGSRNTGPPTPSSDTGECPTIEFRNIHGPARGIVRVIYSVTEVKNVLYLDVGRFPRIISYAVDYGVE